MEIQCGFAQISEYSANLTGQDYDAILVGDVNGNWRRRIIQPHQKLKAKHTNRNTFAHELSDSTVNLIIQCFLSRRNREKSVSGEKCRSRNFRFSAERAGQCQYDRADSGDRQKYNDGDNVTANDLTPSL